MFEGEEMCSSYILIQNGTRVCGEWEYWATNRTYSGRLQARITGPDQAAVELICGRPGSETDTECAYEEGAKESWEKGKKVLFVCDSRLYDNSPAKPCSALGTNSSLPYQPLTDKQRTDIQSQPWAMRCLSKE